jgi:hypothetical protein
LVGLAYYQEGKKDIVFRFIIVEYYTTVSDRNERFWKKKGKKVERGKDACNNTNNKGVQEELQLLL